MIDTSTSFKPPERRKKRRKKKRAACKDWTCGLSSKGSAIYNWKSGNPKGRSTTNAAEDLTFYSKYIPIFSNTRSTLSIHSLERLTWIKGLGIMSRIFERLASRYQKERDSIYCISLTSCYAQQLFAKVTLLTRRNKNSWQQKGRRRLGFVPRPVKIKHLNPSSLWMRPAYPSPLLCLPHQCFHFTPLHFTSSCSHAFPAHLCLSPPFTFPLLGLDNTGTWPGRVPLRLARWVLIPLLRQDLTRWHYVGVCCNTPQSSNPCLKNSARWQMRWQMECSSGPHLHFLASQSINSSSMSTHYPKDSTLSLSLLHSQGSRYGTTNVVMAIDAGLTNDQTRHFFSKMAWSFKDKRQISKCTPSIAGRTISLRLAWAVVQK